jgi:hypothetical protein
MTFAPQQHVQATVAKPGQGLSAARAMPHRQAARLDRARLSARPPITRQARRSLISKA